MINLGSIFKGVKGFAVASVRPITVPDLAERTANEFNLFYGNVIVERDRWMQMASRTVLAIPIVFIIGFSLARFWPAPDRVERYEIPVNSKGVPVSAPVLLADPAKIEVTSDAITDVISNWVVGAFTVTPDQNVEKTVLLQFVNTHTSGDAVSALNKRYQDLFPGDADGNHKGSPLDQTFVRAVTNVHWNEVVKDRSYVVAWNETDKRFDGTITARRTESATITVGVVKNPAGKLVKDNGLGIYVVGFVLGGGS